MSARLPIAEAAALLRRGGVVAYPTEAVWGLGCDPFAESAVLRLLALKQRAVDKGLILVASSTAQLNGIVDWDALPVERAQAVRATWPGPHTWAAPAAAAVPRWITGAHASVAVRVSAHAGVVALCEAFGGVLVSTSANRAGDAPPRTLEALDQALRTAVDGVLLGEVGAQSRPTPIRDALSGDVLRS